MQTNDGIHEVFEGDVQYPYADVGAPEMLHISKVTPETRLRRITRSLLPLLGIEEWGPGAILVHFF